jgi:hypothetical protein
MIAYRVMAVSPDKKQLLRLERPTLSEAFLCWRDLQLEGWFLVGGPEAVRIDEEATL